MSPRDSGLPFDPAMKAPLTLFALAALAAAVGFGGVVGGAGAWVARLTYGALLVLFVASLLARPRRGPENPAAPG